MHARPIRTRAYVRVSSAEQGKHGTSLDGQQDEIRAYCKARGFPAPEMHVEIESGSYERRERRVEQVRLMAELQPGDLVLVAKQDRWSRDTLHYLESTRAILARGARFFSIGEGFDPSTPEGAFASTMMAAVAEQERARIFKRTVGRRRELRDQGLSVEGHCPFGYRRAARKLVPYEPEARLVRLAFALCLEGETIRQIRKRFAAEGTPREKWAVLTLLRRRLYVGEQKDSKGAWHETHPPLVDRVTFDRASAALISRRNSGRPVEAASATSAWLLRGLAVCAICSRKCGPRYSPRTKNDPLDAWYGCNSRLRRAEVDKPCGSEFSRVRTIDEAAAELAFERLTDLSEALSRTPKRAVVVPLFDNTDAKRKLSARRRRVLDMREDGTLTAEEARQRLGRLDTELRSIEETERQELARRRATEALANPTLVRALLSDLKTLRIAWLRSPVEVRREVVGLLAERIELDADCISIWWRTTEELMGDEKQWVDTTYRPGRLLHGLAVAAKRRSA